MKHLVSLLAFSFFAFLSLTAQEAAKETSNGFVTGIMTSNRGSGLEFSYHSGAGRRQWTFNADIYVVRSLHEVKVEPYPFPDRKYVFGKINNFWIARPSFGIQYLLSPQSTFNMIDTYGGIKIGPAIGLLNPYYIKICGLSGDCESVAFNPDIHSYQAISGRASIFNNSLNPELKLGLSLNAYVLLDFHFKAKGIAGIKLGVHADLFPSSIPIMLENDDLNNPSSFVAANIGFIFGGRW